jgi:hypothetical protein
MSEAGHQEQERLMAERGDIPVALRTPQPGFALVGNYLIISDSAKSVERAIEADRGEAGHLSEQSEFKLVAQKMTRLLGTDVPSGILYSRPEETLRMFFEVAKSDGAKNFLSSASADNKYVAGIKRAMDDHPLPDFEQIKKYFRPSGAFITDDETGYHLLAFQLRPGDE